MGYRALVTSNVNLAFRLIGDLALDVTFNPVDVTGFNFGTKVVSENTVAAVNIKAVLEMRKKKSKTRGTKQATLMFKKSDLPNEVTAYQTVTIAGVVWKVGKPIEDNDYIIILEIFSED